MKRLIVIRHAESSPGDPDQPDHDRPLAPRGVRAAGLIGNWLRARGYRPDRALVSTAARAQETWAGITEALDNPPMEPRPDLYHATPAAMLGLLRAAEDVDCLLLIGHQPGIGTLVADLLHPSEPPIDPAHYPAAGTSVLDFEIARWPDLAWKAGRITAHVHPRDLA